MSRTRSLRTLRFPVFYEKYCFNAREFLYLICRCGEIDSKVGRVDAGFFLLCVILASPLQKRP